MTNRILLCVLLCFGGAFAACGDDSSGGGETAATTGGTTATGGTTGGETGATAGTTGGVTSGETGGTTGGETTTTTPEEVRDWDGADAPATCNLPEGITIDIQIGEEEPLYGELPSGFTAGGSNGAWELDLGIDGLWARLLRVSVEGVSEARHRGFFRLSREDDFYCLGRGSRAERTPERQTVFEMRSLKQLGVCPGGTPLEGAIEGCTRSGEGCAISAPGLPFDGAPVMRSGEDVRPPPSGRRTEVMFEGGTLVLFQPRTEDNRDYLEPDEAFVYLLSEDEEERAIYCAGSATLDGSSFRLSELSLLGTCADAEEVAGFVNVCLD